MSSVVNEIRKIKRSAKDRGGLLKKIETNLDSAALRWFVSKVSNSEIVVEVTMDRDRTVDTPKVAELSHASGKSVVLSIIPTGIACEFGGYAGDAAPITNLLAGACDYLITNPNAVNASNFVSIAKNVIYAEGMMIDLFSRGAVNFNLPYSNRIGLIVEKSPKEDIEHIFNLVNAARAIYGIDIVDVYITKEKVGGRCVKRPSGAISGTIDNPQVVVDACEYLIKKGATAIGITTNIQGLSAEEYTKHFRGKFPNPVGGAEAIISHLIVDRFRIPAAHAPLINFKGIKGSKIVDARGAGEMASTSGLECILIGLNQAPQIQEIADIKQRIRDSISINSLMAIVAPAGALGGIPVMYGDERKIPIIAVRDNKTLLNVTARRLGLQNVIEVNNYTEACGVITALKVGVSKEGLYRPLKTLRPH
ncbi:MAG: DUF3326 domain-containing protein [Pseudomonadota bacterium]